MYEDIPVLDLAEFLVRIGDDREFALELIGEFVDTYDTYLEEIEALLAAEDVHPLADKLHGFKGAAANLAAKRVAQIALDAEQAAKQGDLNKTRDYVDEIRAHKPLLMEHYQKENAS